MTYQFYRHLLYLQHFAAFYTYEGIATDSNITGCLKRVFKSSVVRSPSCRPGCLGHHRVSPRNWLLDRP